ncbi:hypothetical protein [Sulfurimonas sp. NWX367]|uniref:hypothetical protein n=1 Tax=Sulfurimonas sp. NWX367 TaxID=2925413 RepID=UPI0032048BE9
MAENAIVLLDNEHTVIYDGQKPVFDTKNKDPELFTAVVVPLKYIHSFSFKIANTISDDELAMKTELKMYKEGGLDVQKEYAVDFIKYELDHEYLIEAFALSLDDFNHHIANFSYKIDVVDLALPRFLIYEALYKTEEEKKSNDLYIYISDDEAFGAIYQNGRYIGHRVINSLNAISKRTGLELVKLKEYLQEKGFNRDNYGLEETLILDTVIEVFSKDIEKIVYSINHKRGLFGLTGIDTVIIDFEGHTLEGIGDFFSQYGFEPVIKPLTHHIQQATPSLSVLLEYLFGLHQGADFHQVNLTHLERKKPLSQYTGFRYLIETLITIVVLLGIGIFVSYYLNQQQERITLLEVKAKERKKKIEDLSLRFKKIKKKNDRLLKEKEGLEDKIFVYETTFRVIPMIGQIGIKRQKMMNDILKVLKKYRLSASSIFQKDEKRFEIQLISQSAKRGNISKFMHDLIELGYKNVMTKDITYEDGVYKSKIYISVKEVE